MERTVLRKLVDTSEASDSSGASGTDCPNVTFRIPPKLVDTRTVQMLPSGENKTSDVLINKFLASECRAYDIDPCVPQ